MNERPIAGKGEVREAVRHVLAMAGGFGMWREKIATEVRALVDPDEVSDQALMDGIEWGLSQNWIRKEYQPVHEKVRYYITQTGLAEGKVT